ncbi:SusC/RagA family TonB-linked outer membrane protein [Pedobacter metabolipauper]|uniref:TonB-linked SusC/RagA family outer membrane protein n=1 Tax=Pedobacter metabolipauper TaxID=425513 RepID=A0A4R6SUS7_9SPHI|nr:SusC/RagA family TonB-linked outer membrane protein [Pedobacter metabolipauper]TDQ09500.1 TonB-linked SusC/RagA family outer membrane protein [Pedobacter metabolipauper]
MKKLLQSLFVSLLFTFSVMAQERTITGTVTGSEDKLPLPGVSVRIKGVKGGTLTGADGKYSIRASSGATLVFTSIGYKVIERVITGSEISVALEADENVLSEVIVSGVAAATSKEKLTVSITKLSEAQLTAVTATSIGNALAGKVAGVRTSSSGGGPGGSVDIQLRGNNNLPGVGSDPLILLDGIILNGGISAINSDDVESMEIIKGAAGSALYGSRAGNGVISIITKRGKGLSMNTTQVTLRNELALSNLADKIDLATHHPYRLATDYLTYVGQYTRYAGVTYPAGYRGAGYDPGISGNRAIDTDHYADNEYGVVNDQQDLLFGTGTNYTNYAAVSSRSEKSNIFTSFENNAQKGVIKDASGYKRQNFRLNLDHQIAPWLKLSTSNLYINTKSSTANGGFWTVIISEPDADFLQPNTDGQPYYIRVNQFNGEQTNPLYGNHKNQNSNMVNRWLGNYSANAKFTQWANLDVSHSIEIQNYDYYSYNPYDTWNSTATAYTLGGLSKESSKTSTNNTQATLNLSGKVADLLIKGKLSYLYEDRKYDFTRATGSGGLKYAGVPQLSNFTTINSTSSTEVEKAENYFAILSLDFKDRYLFDGMFRYDGSSLFGPDSRWNPYFRVSGAYRISQDLTIPGIDEFKIRAAYGTAGIRPGYSYQYEYFTLTNGVPTPSQKGNTGLKPSKTKETEFGLNVNFLKKFTFEGVYAKSTTDDQFLNVGILGFLNGGFPNEYRNAGSIESKTLELTLGANWVNNQDFSWTSNVTFSRIRQKITSLPIPPYLYGSTDGGGAQMFYIKEGETYGAMYGNDWVRSLDQMAAQLPAGKTIGDYEVNSEGYVIDKGTQGLATEKAIKLKDATGNNWYGKIGDGNADFNLGIANTFKYKGFNLYFLVDIKKGGDIYNSKNQWMTRDYRNVAMDMSGVPDGQKKTYDYFVNFYDVNVINTYWVEDASYIKFREVALGYTFSTKQLGLFKGVVKNITAKAIGRNLLTISDYKGYDPEVGSVSQPYDGINKYPNYRSFGFSLTAEF